MPDSFSEGRCVSVFSSMLSVDNSGKMLLIILVLWLMVPIVESVSNKHDTFR